ncbi:MAG: hypothetical protein QXN96_06580, partial [Candidatus Bathyarchaeia archaeon]
MERNIKRKIVTSIVIIAPIFLIGWGCKKQVAPSVDTGAEEPGIEEVEPGVPEGWKEYKNEKWGISFQYPADW